MSLMEATIKIPCDRTGDLAACELAPPATDRMPETVPPN